MRSWKRFDGVVGAVSFGGVVAPELALNEPRSRDDRATIARQSGYDRTSIVVLCERMPAVRSTSSWADDCDCKIKLSHGCDWRFSLIDRPPSDGDRHIKVSRTASRVLLWCVLIAISYDRPMAIVIWWRHWRSHRSFHRRPSDGDPTLPSHPRVARWEVSPFHLS